MRAALFKYRYLASFCLVALALWGAIAVALQTAERDALADARADRRNVARNLAEHVGLLVQSVDLSLLTLRDDWVRDSGTFATAVVTHQKHLKDRAFIQIGVIDVSGWLVWNNLPGWQRINLSDRQHFKVHKERGLDELYISEPVLGRVSKQWSIQFTRPIYDRHDKFAGVLVLSVPPPALQGSYSDIDLGEGSSITLVRSDGKILARSHDFNRIADVSLAGTPGLGANDATEGEGRYRAKIDGVERQTYYQRVPDYPLTIYVGQAVDTVLAPYLAQRKIYVSAGVVATALLFVLTLLLIARRANQKEVNQYRAELAAIVQNSSDAIISTDRDGRIVSWNMGAQHLYGYAEPEVLGQPISITMPPDYVAKCATVLPRILRGERVPNFESVRVTKDGRRFDVQVAVSPIKDADGTVIGASTIVHDITERKQNEIDLHIAAVAFESQEAIVVTDADGIILRVNRAFIESTGYAADEIVGQTPRVLKSGRHTEEFYRAMWEDISQTGGWQGEIWDRRKNGEIYPKWLAITAVKSADDTVTHYVGTHTDITARKAADEQIAFLAYHDALTRLPNRLLMQDRLQQALASSARSGHHGALFLLDLDNFKTINDTLGHEKGDLLLQQVAQRLVSCVREGDTVVRLGGDEFVVLVQGLSEHSSDAVAQAETVGEKMLAALSQPYLLAGHENVCSASIGCTMFCGNKDSTEELLKQADLAMYQSKSAGRNVLRFFDTKMQTTVVQRATLVSELRAAVKHEQFVLYYQPQVVGVGYLTGAEALLRWQHPERGIEPPAEFIPLAEETNLIVPLGLWVLETACKQMAQWATHSITSHLSVAVNISAKQLQQADFADQVLDVLQRTGANPQLLKLELTESLLVSDIEITIEKMQALRKHGVGFAVDDFGTGYSSLSYLKQLPLNELKIDRSFVRNILTDPNDAAIARMVISLAGSLGLPVIAEGVETKEQHDFLASLGCHDYQGYLFSRPLPLDEFEAFVRRV